jgi:hypothetical protein
LKFEIKSMGNHGKKIEVDTSKGYEKNDIELRGIVLTVVALFITCVLAFWLMYILQVQMDKAWEESDKKDASPMAMKPEEKLPPEPRLQGAPGFGVDGPKGRINLELKDPRSEMWELQKIWAEEEKNGQKIDVMKDGKPTGEVKIVTLPIAEAKKQLLAQGIKTISAEDGKKNAEESIKIYSSSSSGRTATEKRW